MTFRKRKSDDVDRGFSHEERLRTKFLCFLKLANEAVETRIMCVTAACIWTCFQSKKINTHTIENKTHTKQTKQNHPENVLKTYLNRIYVFYVIKVGGGCMCN